MAFFRFFTYSFRSIDTRTLHWWQFECRSLFLYFEWPRKFWAWAKHSCQSQECVRIFGMHKNAVRIVRMQFDCRRMYSEFLFRRHSCLFWHSCDGGFTLQSKTLLISSAMRSLYRVNILISCNANNFKCQKKRWLWCAYGLTGYWGICIIVWLHFVRCGDVKRGWAIVSLSV